MLIEQDELLLAWIREQVALICDAEPTAFAKYVLALLRKSTTEEDGQKLCITQLEVFLQANTESFVNKLFTVLQDKSYMKEQEENEHTRDPSPVLTPIDINPEKEESGVNNRSEVEALPSTANREEYSQQTDEKLKDDNEPAEKCTRPRILPPEKRPEEEEQAQENLLKANRLIQLSASSKRRSTVGLNRVGGHLQRPVNGRYMIRVDNQRSSDSRSRSRSPIRETRTSGIQDIFVGGKHRRCRNYEVLGYCLRGYQCPFKHGSTPITVAASPHPPAGYGSTPTIHNNNNNYSGVANQVAYNPEAPALNLADPALPHHNPMIRANEGGQPPRRKLTNSVLVKRIPPEFNHIYNINEYFSQFGEIKNIQVSFENCADTALVTYESASSATKAFKSKKAIFDNRFVYLMYHTPTTSHQPNASAFQTGAQWQTDVAMGDGQTKHKVIPPRPASDYAKVFTSSSGTCSKPSAPTESLRTRRLKLKAPGQPPKNLQPIAVDKAEAMLKLKTDLYLKISEQLQLVLRQAQLTDGRARRAVMDKVTQLQKNLAEIRNDLLSLHKKVNREGDRVEA